MLSQSRYRRDFLSRDWQTLSAMYRTSWVVGTAVDVVGEDMVSAGLDITGPIEPSDIQGLQNDMRRLLVHERFSDAIKWGRLYGGSVSIMLIDGQDVSTPLQLESVAPGQFRGLLSLDRWMVQPSTSDLVTEFCPDLGRPKFYGVLPAAPALRNEWVHYSRLVRFEGVPLPWQESFQENLWGQSVVERLFDRLLAFDSATVGAAQLTFKSYLRTIKMKGLRQMIGAGGKALEAVTAHLDFIRAGQTNEGLTVLDAEDDFVTNSYSFSGLDSILIQMGQQISGALQIPLVRLFGQSPSGLNSSGESDLRTYYDGINTQREARLRDPYQTVLDLVFRNRFQKPMPPEIGFTFGSLWQLTDEQKATIAGQVATAVGGAFDAGLISQRVALQELRQSSVRTGVFSNITDADIEKAEEDPPSLNEEPEGGAPFGGPEALEATAEDGPDAPGDPAEKDAP
jgi:phage-related protein (TIGR01555 family)